MDYLHYKVKGWKPGEYLQLSHGKQRIARAYMLQQIEEEEKEREEAEKEAERARSGV